MHPVQQLGNLHCRHLGDGFPVYPEAGRFLAQAGAVADGTFNTVLNVAYYTLPTHHLQVVAFAYAVQVVGAIDQQRDVFIGDVFYRFVK